MPTATQICACKACKCEIQPEKSFKQNGQYYCTEQCAKGHTDHQGCGHPGCDCK